MKRDELQTQPAASQTKRRRFLYSMIGLAGLTGAATLGASRIGKPERSSRPRIAGDYKVVKSDEQWRQILSQEQFDVLRRGGTEPSFDNQYCDHTAKGVYACVACGNRMFHSSAKFESGAGWPSFSQPIDSETVYTRPDDTLVARRTEVVCSRCDGHIGHVFQDGPAPTGLRYCLNSVAMTFYPEFVNNLS